MELNPQKMAELKKVELAMLKNFIEVCDQLNLRYYLLEGTLLGAVRHKGFIPWDDDIDVGMPRHDYEIFMREGQALLPSEYFVQNIFTEPDYRANFAKIRNSNTTFIETSVNHCEINHGIYIDIFPLDYGFEDAQKQNRMIYKFKVLSARIGLDYNLPRPQMTVMRTLRYTLLRILYPTVRKAILQREKLFRSVPESQTFANYCSAWWKKEFLPVSWFGEGEYLEFEGLKARVPKEYDKWLTAVYGDYMQLPPEEKRIAHHYADVIDTEKSYLEYIQKKNKRIDSV